MKKLMLSRVSALALVGGIASFGLPGAAFAVVALPPACSGTPSFDQSSEVTTITEDLGGDRTKFSYRVCNLTSSGAEGGTVIRDWEIPVFGSFVGSDFVSDAGIDFSTITSPEGWSFNIEKVGVDNAATGWDGDDVAWQDESNGWNEYFDSLLGEGNPYDFDASKDQYVMHWYTNDPFDSEYGGGYGIFQGEDLDGFSFEADNPTAVDAPFQTSWVDEPANAGDPPIPGTPLGDGFVPLGDTIRNALNPQTQLPEPGSLAVFAAGLLAMGGMARRRKKQMDEK